jgi:flagellar basal body-associated protein FliL
MSKKIVIIIVVCVLLLACILGYFYWKNLQSKKPSAIIDNQVKQAESALEAVNEAAIQGVLPSISTNPIENKPDINPADKTNPLDQIKTNPFE